MKESLIMGLALGFIIGAVLVQSNPKAQQMVEKGKDFVKEQVQNM